MGGASAAARNSAADRPIPVVAANAVRGDVHIYLVGLGQVTPFDTDTVHTRVDGEIMKIYYKEGQDVKKDDPLVEIDPRPYQAMLEAAEGQLEKDQANLDNANIDLTRYEQGYKDGSVSDQQMATQRATVKQDEGAVEVDQSQIDTVKLDLVYCHVLSPITGRIGLQQVNLGNIVHATDTNGLAVVTQHQPIAVVFPLPEDDLPQVLGAPGGGVGLTVDAYDHADQNKLATGKIEAIDNEIDPTTGTFKIKASFENKDDALFPNQFVNAHLLVSVNRSVVLVPTAAVQLGPDGSAFCYVVHGTGSASPAGMTVDIRSVQEGPGEGDFTSVTGLQPGETVVTDGTDKLQPGSKVTVTMSQAAGPTTRPGGGRGRGRRGATTAPSAIGGAATVEASPSTQESP